MKESVTLKSTVTFPIAPRKPSLSQRSGGAQTAPGAVWRRCCPCLPTSRVRKGGPEGAAYIHSAPFASPRPTTEFPGLGADAVFTSFAPGEVEPWGFQPQKSSDPRGHQQGKARNTSPSFYCTGEHVGMSCDCRFLLVSATSSQAR